MTKYVLILLCIGLTMACSDNKDKASVVGNWDTAEWYVKNDNAPISQKMNFEFDSTGRYKVDYGSVIEEGDYRVQYSTLYTKEDGQTEKSVVINKLTQDSLVMEMNRAGRAEIIVLVRQK